MSPETRFQILLSALTLIFLVMSATLGFVMRAVTRLVRTEVRLENLGKDMSELVVGKDKTHAEMLSMMTHDREASDTRLRYLEEARWEQGRVRRR